MTSVNDPTAEAGVIIVGGGPVGLGLAIGLAQRGVACTVVERHRAPQPIPKGQNLTQRTMEHFHFWGAEQALRAARTIPPEYGIGGMTSYGTLLGEYHYDWLQRELVRPFYFTDNERLPQYATEAVLRRRAAELPGLRTLYGWSAGDITQDAHGVRVSVAEREGPGREVLEGSWIVGCDGARSHVREAVGITQTRTDHDRLMVLLVFRSAGLHELLRRFPGKSFYNVLHPELQGYWRFFGRVDLGSTWFFHAPVPPGTTRDNTDFTACLHEAVGATFDVAFEHIGFWELRIAVADAYRAGRAFLAGDAAHSHPPYGGYGINTGFEDAANLAWKLAGAVQGWAGPGLLDSYEEERRPVFVSTARDFIERGIQADRDFLRDFDPARDREAFERAWEARRGGAKSEVGAFEPNYAGASIIHGSGEAGPSAAGAHEVAARPGHHLTPLPLAEGRNVYEELNTGFALLTFDPGDPEVGRLAAEATRRGVPLTILRGQDAGTQAKYGARHVLVRPDQYVAWSGDAIPDHVLSQAVGW